MGRVSLSLSLSLSVRARVCVCLSGLTHRDQPFPVIIAGDQAPKTLTQTSRRVAEAFSQEIGKGVSDVARGGPPIRAERV